MAGLERPRFETNRAMDVAGVHYPQTPASMGAGVPKQWDEFASEIALLPGAVGKAEFGLWFNILAKGGTTFYVAGTEIGQFAPAPPSFMRVKLTPRMHAVFPHKSGVSTTRATIDASLAELPKLGKEHFGAYAGAPDFYEVYVDGYQAAKRGEGRIEIWVPLKR